jgi:cell division septum initiation protein DivIVA
MTATQEEIAAAWSAWQSRHGGKLGPGPAFVEAINAALALRLPTLESLQRENEELRQRLDVGPCGEDAIDIAESAADHLRHRAEAAEAEVKRLRSVLQPMADVAGDVSDSWPDDAQVVTEIGHFRRARTALASTGGEHHAE